MARKDADRKGGGPRYKFALSIRLLRIPNALVLKHPDEFVRKFIDAIGTATEKARK